MTVRLLLGAGGTAPAGARSDNPTRLDRPYVATWWAISATVVLLVAVIGAVRSRRPRAEG